MASRPDGTLPNGRRLDRASAVNRGLGRFGLRVRLGAIAMAVAIPLLVANVVWLATDVAAARTAASDETGRLAEAVASSLDQALEGTRSALVAIAAEEVLQSLDPEGCSIELAALLPQLPEYSNLSAADRDGVVFCSAVPSSGTVTVDDRDWFRRVLGGAPFVVGGYQVGRIVGVSLIVGAVPIRGPSGDIVGTAQASINLARLAAVVGQTDLPAGAALNVIDREGTVLVRQPDGESYVGQRLPESELVDAVLAQDDGIASDHGGATTLPGLDGVERLYAIHGVATGDDALHVAVGFSVDQAYAGAAGRFAAGAGILLVALLVALALMVALAGRLIVGPVETLVGAANRIAGGDLDARTGLGGSDELGRLADAFDRMADSVQDRVEARTAELSAAVTELESADRRVHEYLDIAVDPLVVARAIRDADGTIVDFENTFANEPALDTVGEAVARAGSRVSSLPPELAEARIRMWAGVVEAAEPLEYETAFGHARTAEELDLLARVTKVGDGVAVAFRDISSAKRLQRALESAKAEAERAREAAESARAEAERANLSKTEFLSRMSHELRTPLNAVIGFAQILELDGLEGDQAESVDHILRSGRHLLSLINEVLDISRIESGTLTTSPEPVDAGEAVRDAVDVITPLAREHGLTIDVRMPDDRPHVLADRQRLKQILLNLLSNAVKFNRPSGTVEVSAAVTGTGRCRITVRDEGPGIPEAMRERVFAPFDRLGAETGRIEGTGLGLSLSRALAERMDGTLDFESSAGKGSTFWVELPTAAPALAGATGPAALRTTPRAMGTVLYIEDNLSNLQLVSRIFERQGGVRVVPAMLGGLGLELAREGPDLVLLDLHLPDMSGEEILARLLADPATRDIPVVVMSADATPGVVDRLIVMGASAFVTKPIAISEFIATIDRLLARRPPAPDQDA